MTETRGGRCLCGAVRFRAVGAPRFVAHCHCESCRRQTSSPFTTYAGYAAADVSFEGLPLSRHVSSPGVVRSFCPRCGAPMAYEGPRWPGEVHLFAAAFDDPASLAPSLHVNTAEALPWIHMDDGLRRIERLG